MSLAAAIFLSFLFLAAALSCDFSLFWATAFFVSTALRLSAFSGFFGFLSALASVGFFSLVLSFFAFTGSAFFLGSAVFFRFGFGGFFICGRFGFFRFFGRRFAGLRGVGCRGGGFTGGRSVEALTGEHQRENDDFFHGFQGFVFEVTGGLC